MDEEIILISLIEKINEDGNYDSSKEETIVFCEEMSVTQSEFYKSDQSGFKVSLVVQIWSEEYDGQEEASYKGNTFRLVRSFKKDEMIELYYEES